MCSADASINISLEELVPINLEKNKAIINVESIVATQKFPQAPCRAMSQTLEAIIHATRVRALANDETQQKKVGHLLEMISDCDKVVKKVAPNSSYVVVMNDLIRRLVVWRKLK